MRCRLLRKRSPFHTLLESFRIENFVRIFNATLYYLEKRKFTKPWSASSPGSFSLSFKILLDYVAT